MIAGGEHPFSPPASLTRQRDGRSMYYAGDPADIWSLGLIDFVDPAPTWFAQAACRGKTAVFFLDKGQPATEAKLICAGCPVRQECLDYAIAKREVRGIWGGLTPVERRQARLR